jgi:hypothetical protein
MPILGNQNHSLAPFPRWIGPLWLFLVFLEIGWDWSSLLICAGIPWLCAWAIWTRLARTSYVQAISPDTIDTGWRWAAGAIWLAVISLGGGVYYVNHYLPHGPMYDTGDVVCQNDGRGPCGEEYKEDFRSLDIPQWAKFLKGSEAELLLMGLVFAGCVASSRPSGGFTEKSDDY